MLILAPSTKSKRDEQSIQTTIRERMARLRRGDIASLYRDAMAVSSWTAPTNRPERPGNRAAQIAADADNFRSAAARVCSDAKVASIGPSNIEAVHALYLERAPSLNFPVPPPTAAQRHRLPGDICKTILAGAKRRAGGANCDTIDMFIDLAAMHHPDINNDLRDLFDLVYNNCIPAAVRGFFTDTYLFCLYKDPEDLTKLRPLGIPSAMRRIIATHVTKESSIRFAQSLLPYNFAIGVNGGMNFIIKTMQLAMEKFITKPQEDDQLPTRAAFFADIKNMFNSVYREAMTESIRVSFPELLPLAHLLYGAPGSVHHRWEDGSWKVIEMVEGVNQGCPLSALFAALVLDRVIRPLDGMLRERAQERVANGDYGDDGQGSVTNMFAWVDDVCSCIPLVDLRFFCTTFSKLAAPLGFNFNIFKNRILTSTNGVSILDGLAATNPSLAVEVTNTIAEFSVRKDTINAAITRPVELTAGFRLLGTPVGSPAFALEFFNEQLAEVRTNVTALNDGFTDLQTRLRIFTQCTIQKLPHLLGADIMHNLPDDFLDGDTNWWNWNGPLTAQLDAIISSFLATLLGREDIPTYALLISQISVGMGGLGLLNASHRAAPDFVITMASAMKMANDGIGLNKDLEPFEFCQSITDLYLPYQNPRSDYLRRFHQLLPDITAVACSPRTPMEQRAGHFLSKVSSKSARSYIKKFCGNVLTQELYAEMELVNPQHVPHLASLLSPHMSSPLVSMSRSIPGHRIVNWTFMYGMLRKLRLPIYDPNNCPRCWCGKTHDCWGDHGFSCTENNKIMAHHYIRDGWALALQRVLASAGYIRPTAKLETEKPHLIDCDPGASPLDLSFNIDPSPSPAAPATCEYICVGGDVTITPPVLNFNFSQSANVIESVTAAADTQLQKKEKGKLMRESKRDTVTEERIDGDRVIGELIQKNIMLIPMAVDPHGRLGPFMMRFLFGTTPPPMVFQSQ